LDNVAGISIAFNAYKNQSMTGFLLADLRKQQKIDGYYLIEHR